MDPVIALPDAPDESKTGSDESYDEDAKRHDELVILIARTRFAYPSKESPSLRTYVNQPERTLSVAVSSTESLYPDIVVANIVTKKAATIAEVETRMTINNERAKRWKKYSSMKETNLYLFVPQSQVEHVRALVSFFQVRVTGIRIYAYSNLGKAIVSDA